MKKLRTSSGFSRSFFIDRPLYLFLAAVLFVSIYVFVFGLPKVYAAATTCYWVGDTSPAAWNDITHWSSANGGAGSTCDGGVVPGSDDIATFTSANTNSANVDVAVNVKGIAINAGYTGTISQDAGQTVALGTSGFVQAAGIYSSTESITITAGPFTKTGGTFSEGFGTITFAGGASTLSANTQTFNNFIINKTHQTSLAKFVPRETQIVKTGFLYLPA